MRTTGPPRGRHPMLDEGLDLVDAAREEGTDARLVGGIAVLALCSGSDLVRLEHRDLDVVAPRGSARRLLAALGRLGYEENRHVRLASGGALLQAYRPCVHRDPQGRLVHPDDRVDAHFGTFHLHHTLALERRLRRERYTVPPSDVLLAKLLRTRMSEPDVRDVAVLLFCLDLREEEGPGAVGLRYLSRVCAHDWGLYHDVCGNLERVVREAGVLFPGAPAEPVRERAGRLLAALRGARKGARWRLRAVFGERVRWYDDVDETDGRRIGLLEGPEAASPPAASGGR